MTFFIKIIAPLVCIIACSNQQPAHIEIKEVSDNIKTLQQAKDSFARNEIIERVVCKNDTTQSYALYIPFSDEKTLMPVIYCFDPHGDGALPLHHYKTLADAYHFILIGSNNSKNGNDWNTTQTIWNNLFTDTKNRVRFNVNRIYTCGFSGGAKVAGFIGLHQPEIKSVIAAGAGLPDQQPIQNFQFHFTAMAGNGDMNMTDLVVLDNELTKTTTKHRLILFDGKHAWPPDDAMRTAFTALQCDAMRNQLIPKDDSLIAAYIEDAKRKTGSFITEQQLIPAQQTCALAENILAGLTPGISWFQQKENSIVNSAVYQQQLQRKQQLFSIEQTQKQTFQQQFSQGDIAYWTATIKDLQTKAKANTDAGSMNQRLLAYLSLAFYSISNQLIGNNENEAAQHFVILYKMADATNPEAWYFSALLNARNRLAKSTQDDLLKAASYGFTDTVRMAQEKAFETLSPKPDFALIEGNMKKAE